MQIFDIDKNSNQNSNFNMPKKEEWEKIVSELGIKNSDHIIIYDNSNVISSLVCGILSYFNHNPI